MLSPIDIFVNLDDRENSIVESKQSDATGDLFFRRGDTYNVRIHLRLGYASGDYRAYQLDDKTSLKVAGGIFGQNAETADFVCFQDQFDEIMDEDGDICYQGTLSFSNTASSDLIGTADSSEFIFEIALVDQLFGNQYTSQSTANLGQSLIESVPYSIESQPNIAVGSYSSVVSLANGIVDQRIFDLKAGAPLEFDTLYELAEYAQRTRSLEFLTGNFEAYLEGKRLADQNMTVVSLGQLAINESTYLVSHEPWRPWSVTASLYDS